MSGDFSSSNETRYHIRAQILRAYPALCGSIRLLIEHFPDIPDDDRAAIVDALLAPPAAQNPATPTLTETENHLRMVQRLYARLAEQEATR